MPEAHLKSLQPSEAFGYYAHTLYCNNFDLVAHSTVKCNAQIFGVEENLTRSLVAEYLSGAIELILDPLDIGIGSSISAEEDTRRRPIENVMTN